MSSSALKPAPHLPIQHLLKHNWQKMVKKSADYSWRIYCIRIYFLLTSWVGGCGSCLCSPLSFLYTNRLLFPCWICTRSCNILTWCKFSGFFFLVILAGNGQQRRRSIQDLSVAGTDSNQVNTQCGQLI